MIWFMTVARRYLLMRVLLFSPVMFGGVRVPPSPKTHVQHLRAPGSKTHVFDPCFASPPRAKSRPEDPGTSIFDPAASMFIDFE